MSATDGNERRSGALGKFVERLHDPTQLRIFLMLAVLTVAYAAVYMPFHDKIADATRKLADAKNRLSLAGDIERLRKQYAQVEGRLSQQSDANEWLQYVLGGIRKSPLKLSSITPGTSQALGPYQVVSLNIKLSGGYPDVDKFLHWLESNERLFRVDAMKLSASTTPEGIEIILDLTVVGVIG